eukprot:TRINITY_DN15584_c0_g1_i1.p1 TRINITY_DN15584_c0_g1~~TRINITY_DN15584_c0_g1_i1.p1  ORF type:complete len:247 (+),score=28.08 TRINITY_DN15584_c0_g1_i1:88-828(+)
MGQPVVSRRLIAMAEHGSNLGKGGLTETAGIGVRPRVYADPFAGICESPGVCAEASMALAQYPFMPHSEDSFSTPRRPAVDVSDEVAPIVFISRQKKPIKLFCGWCGARRMRPGVRQIFCGCCGKALDGVDKKGQDASVRPTMHPDMPADHWTSMSGGAAKSVFGTIPTRPRTHPGQWSSTNQAGAGLDLTAAVCTAELWPRRAPTPVEQQTLSMRKAGTPNLVHKDFFHHPGSTQKSFTVEGIRL